MSFSLTTFGEEETMALGERLSALLCGGAVVLLDGDLGAGKTRFAQGVARGLGLTGIVTSPTFNLVLEYPVETGDGSLAGTPAPSLCPNPTVPCPPAKEPSPVSVLRHFDLYRLEQADQLDDLDYFALIEEPDAVSLVEWGSKFASQLPLDYILVHLKVDETDPNKRFLELSAEGDCSQELLGRFARSEGMQPTERGGQYD